MKTLFILFDSLNRNSLSCYNPNAAATPAFDRLAALGTVFDTHYAGSLPCMPARRDLLTGRLNFLHRSWGPVEPFDHCFPDTLRQHGIYSHLISDHYHYWEEGGCGYHNRYSSAEFVRGQERDLWKAMVQPPLERFRQQYHPMLSEASRRAPNMVNREYIRHEEDFPIVQCVKLANEFLATNHSADNWFLQVEMFDPHEPFTSPERFKQQASGYSGPILDWPLYDQLDLTDNEARELTLNYQAVVQMCDHYLGRLLATFDQYDLWKDTAIILTTDHGFLLGEHNWWGKNRMPVLDPIAHIPLMMYHPQQANGSGNRCQQLTQCLDITPTILELHGIDPSVDNSNHCGQSLLSLMQTGNHTTVRDYALFGLFGGAVNITDGRYTYFHYPSDTTSPLHEYTLMPVHPASYFTREEFNGAELVHNQPFGNGYPLLKLSALDNARRPPMQGGAFGDATNSLYDVKADPQQSTPLDQPDKKAELINAITRLFRENDAPAELYTRFDL